MDFTQKLVKAKAQQLLEGLKEQYPYVYVEISEVEKYVRESNKYDTTPTVDLLYDFLLSQGLCEVEE